MSSPTQPPAGGDQNQTQALIGMTIAMLSLSTIFVSLRFIVRVYVVKSVWWDDWTSLFALLGTAVGAGLDFVEFNYGYGHHRYYIHGPAYNRLEYYRYGQWIQTFVTLMWTKISICLFLSRIPATRALRTPLYIAILMLFISNLILTLLWVLQCLPVNATWDFKVPGKCFTKSQLLQIILAQGIISAISDFALAAYPILILAHVQISLRKRIGLCLLMSLGVITGACCVVRNVLNWTNESTDSTWDTIPNWMWRCLEVNFGMAAACLPAIYPGYRAMRQRFDKYYSLRSGSRKKTEPEKAHIWHNTDKTTRDTKTTATASAPDVAVDPEITIPAVAILKTTEFSVQHRSKSKDSAEKLMAGTNNILGESTEPATRWYSLGESGSQEHNERSMEYMNMPKATTGFV